jgi:uncharacterized protein (TIGR03118 family)
MTHKNRFVSVLGSALIIAAMAGYACAAGYTQTNLVTNGGDPTVTAAHTDPNLVNPWGISFLPAIPGFFGGTPFWVSDNNAGVATLYDGLGDIVPLVVEILSPGDNPSVEPNMNTGTPTGQVANLTLFTATPAFSIPSFGPAIFIFATEDGQIEAWNQALVDPDGDSGPPFPDDAVIVVNNSAGTPGGGAAGAVYKGLALATRTVGANANVPFLYATNFRTGTVDVFDGTFSPVTVPGGFKDPNVQDGYAPFGIQNINNHIWVQYALQNAAKHDPVNKPGHGFSSIFDTDGNLLSHFAQHGHLDSPWGVALAPADFGEFANDILIGNFGDGQINAYNPANGHWLGMLSDASGKPIINPGLWTVTFSGAAGHTAVGADPDTLYITAGLVGPTHENAGLFAKISPAP